MPSTRAFRAAPSNRSRISRSPVWNRASFLVNENRNRAPRATNRVELPSDAGSKRRGAVANTPDAARVFATAPLRFEPASDGNSTRFVARGARFRVSFTKNEALFQTGERDIRLRFEGAARNARVEGIDTLRSKTAVYTGNDASKWRRAIPNYARLQVRDLYPGVDLVYYGSPGELEYDLNVKPG